MHPNKPSVPKTRIVRHGSGYQVFDGRTKVHPTTNLSTATRVARQVENQYKRKLEYYYKYKR